MTINDRALSAPRPVTPMSILAEQARANWSAGSTRSTASTTRSRPTCRTPTNWPAGWIRISADYSTPESAALRLLDQRTGAEDWDRRPDSAVHLEQEMLSGHVEGQTLKMLVHATRARRVLEIGMFTGYSALAMAEALPADGMVVACEIDAEVAAFARRCFDASPDGAKVEIKVGPALTTLDRVVGYRRAFRSDLHRRRQGRLPGLLSNCAGRRAAGIARPDLRGQHPDAGPTVGCGTLPQTGRPSRTSTGWSLPIPG